MGIIELFSKREKRKQKQGQEDVFQYDDLPKPFRIQVIHIWKDALGTYREMGFGLGPMHYPSNIWWTQIRDSLTREKGVFRLAANARDPFDECQAFLLGSTVDDALDIIELTFRFIDGSMRSDAGQAALAAYHLVHPNCAIDELNKRFKEHAIGYEFVSGEIIRVDSKFMHAEAVRPALQLLHGAGTKFNGAMQEFLGAHERLRKCEYMDAIVWALKAFESTMKAICAERHWPYDPQKHTAKQLLDILYANKLVPDFIQQHLGGLRSALESGIPTIRNKTAGHGQGPDPAKVPNHLAAYALHLTASNIVFLVESHKAMK